MTLALRYGARTDVGLLRRNNQDAMYAGPRLLAIADGMGGHAAGEVASRVAIDAVAPLDLDQPGADLVTGLRDAVETASGYLRDMVAADSALEGMGTTLTALLFDGRRLGLLHVGDSRGYVLRDGVLTQITHDHTLVQRLVDEGRITPEEASSHPQRSWITNALDGRGELELDLSIREARAGDRYLLCSDGLSGVVSEDTIAETLAGADPQATCDQLVDLALRAGGPDNISCIVADVVDSPDTDQAPILGGAATERDPRNPLTGAVDTPATRAAVLLPNDSPNGESPDSKNPDGKTGARRAPGRSHRARGSHRLAIVLTAIVVVVAAAVVGTWLYVRSQYFVAASDNNPATVGIYRGVSGKVLGLDLSSLDEKSDLPLDALPSYEQQRVRTGIDASSRSDARRILSRLRDDACAQAATSTGSSSGTAPASPAPTRTPSPVPTPTPSPVPTPTYCRTTP
jgi:PPM family protein phosphatase